MLKLELGEMMKKVADNFDISDERLEKKLNLFWNELNLNAVDKEIFRLASIDMMYELERFPKVSDVRTYIYRYIEKANRNKQIAGVACAVCEGTGAITMVRECGTFSHDNKTKHSIVEYCFRCKCSNGNSFKGVALYDPEKLQKQGYLQRDYFYNEILPSINN